MNGNYPDKLFHNRYRLIEKKGRGSFAEVWLAHDENLDMDVAVKIYIALDDNGIIDFRDEFRTSWTLNHPNLLHAYNYEIDDNCPFLVMPYCPTKSESLIGTADEEEIWKFIRDVSSGLSYIHDLDIVHHDIKPENILKSADDKYMISDFGISKKMRSTLRKNSMRQADDSKEIGGGSPAYMAPELFSATPDAVKATDIWAFGVTLFEIVTGSLPFYGQGGGMLLHGAELPEIDANVSQELKDLITACLQKETWDRPTAQQLCDYAKAHLEGEAISERWYNPEEDEPDEPYQIPPPPKKPIDFFTVLYIVMAIFFVVSAILMFSTTPEERGEALNFISSYFHLKEYNKLIKQCDGIINNDVIDIDPFSDETLKADIAKINELEEKYGDSNKHYRNNCKSLKHKFAKKWADAADEQVRIGNDENISKAFELYYKSLSYEDNSEIRANFEKEAKLFAFMNPVEIELRGEGDWGENLYADKIKYLHTRLKYRGLDPTNSHNVRLILKIYVNGHLDYNANLYSSSYSYYHDNDIEPGNSIKYLNLSGWGRENVGAYSKCSLRVEVWCDNKKLIFKEATIY